MTRKIEIIVDEVFSRTEIKKLATFGKQENTRGRLNSLCSIANAIVIDEQLHVLDQEDKTIRMRPAVLSKAKRIVR
jgi:hypothetical protein